MHPFTDQPAATVSALGEARLIAAIRRWLGSASPRAPFGIGDDCAVMPPGKAAQLITVDPVIYGEHFDDHVSPADAGKKLFNRNLSDIAAMGGRPRAAVVALALDPRTRLDWLEAFYRGLATISRRHHVPIVGGDIARQQGGIIATLTLMGEAGASRVMTRTGAKIGDWIYVTGRLGGSLSSGHHCRFTPRLAEGTWLACRPEAQAMMDLSDGLAKDLFSLTPRGAYPAIQPSAIPRRAHCSLSAALCDGEDYELLIAVAGQADCARLDRAWRRAFPRLSLTRIGRFVPSRQRPSDCIDLSAYHGFEHLR